MKRVSKFELMRIVSIYLIVLHHAILHGVLNLPLTTRMKYPGGSATGTILEMGGGGWSLPVRINYRIFYVSVKNFF